jgi:hypothetical protein
MSEITHRFKPHKVYPFRLTLKPLAVFLETATHSELAIGGRVDLAFGQPRELTELRGSVLALNREDAEILLKKCFLGLQID